LSRWPASSAILGILVAVTAGIKSAPEFAEDYSKQRKRLAAPGSARRRDIKTRAVGWHGV